MKEEGRGKRAARCGGVLRCSDCGREEDGTDAYREEVWNRKREI